jgi:hypothetical protein
MLLHYRWTRGKVYCVRMYCNLLCTVLVDVQLYWSRVPVLHPIIGPGSRQRTYLLKEAILQPHLYNTSRHRSVCLWCSRCCQYGWCWCNAGTLYVAGIHHCYSIVCLWDDGGLPVFSVGRPLWEREDTRWSTVLRIYWSTDLLDLLFIMLTT